MLRREGAVAVVGNRGLKLIAFALINMKRDGSVKIQGNRVSGIFTFEFPSCMHAFPLSIFNYETRMLSVITRASRFTYNLFGCKRSLESIITSQAIIHSQARRVAHTRREAMQ